MSSWIFRLVILGSKYWIWHPPWLVTNIPSLTLLCLLLNLLWILLLCLLWTIQRTFCPAIHRKVCTSTASSNPGTIYSTVRYKPVWKISSRILRGFRVPWKAGWHTDTGLRAIFSFFYDLWVYFVNVLFDISIILKTSADVLRLLYISRNVSHCLALSHNVS